MRMRCWSETVNRGTLAPVDVPADVLVDVLIVEPVTVPVEELVDVFVDVPDVIKAPTSVERLVTTPSNGATSCLKDSSASYCLTIARADSVAALSAFQIATC